MKEAISCVRAPQAVGPYSQAVKLGNLVFVSGQLGMDPQGAMAGEDVATQARQAMGNLQAILEAAGLSLADVIKATIFLTDMGDFAAVNEIYQEFFTPPYPARACVQVAALPRQGKVEIEVVAGRS